MGCGGANFATVSGVVNDQIGVRADFHGAFAGVQAENLRGAGAGSVHKTLNGQVAATHAVGVKQVHAVFNGGDAVGNLVEITVPHVLLLDIKGAVVGGNGVYLAPVQRVPESGLIGFIAQWRGHHMFRTLYALALGISFVEGQVRNDHLNFQVNAAIPGVQRGSQGASVAQVDDVPFCARHLDEGGKVCGAFGLHAFGAAGFVPFGASFTLGEQLLLQFRYEVGVLTVSRDHHVQLLCQLAHLIKRVVINAKGPFIRQKHLEGLHALPHQLAQVALSLVVPVGHADMKTVVAGAFAVGHARPEVPSVHQVFITRRREHLDISGRPADQCGLGTRRVGVLGKRAHKRQMDVNVRVNEAGKHEFAAGINHAGIRWSAQILANLRDLLALHQHIGLEPLAVRNNFTILDE